MNPEMLPPLAPLVFWLRAHFLAVIVGMLIIGEVFFQSAMPYGINRQAQLVENSDDPGELQRATDALEILGLYDIALVGLNRIKNPASQIHVRVAALYGIQRRFLRAEESARRAIEIDPNNAAGYFYLGLAANELDRKNEAIECFRKARDLGLAVPTAYFAKS
jgi:tetratricopeptide (TPR) repeat protein